MIDKDKLIKLGIQKRNKELKYVDNKEYSWYEIGISCGIGGNNIGEKARCFVKDFIRNNTKAPSEEIIKYKEVIEINKDGSNTSEKIIQMSNSESKDVNFLLKIHGYCNKTWEIVSAKSSIWDVNSKESGTKKLYSSKIIVKPKTNIMSMEEIKLDLKEHFISFSENYSRPFIKKISHKSDKMLEIPIMDLHLGKLGHKDETGENYDHKIAEQRFLQIINDIIERTKHYNFEKIIFPIGQDFFQFNSIESETVAGTRVDSDVRWYKLFLKGVDLLVKSIELLSEVSNVEVFYVPGNHDKSVSYYALNYIYAWFRNNQRVSVDLSPSCRTYKEYGNSLVGYSHGNFEKKKISNIMQVEAREQWGRTKYHEFHLGHYHSEITKEENGLIIRHISSVTGTDAWHNESGFIGAVKKAQAFIWDKEYGLTDILHSIII